MTIFLQGLLKLFELLNAEDPEVGKGMLLLAYFLKSILLAASVSSTTDLSKQKKNSKKCHRVNLYCILLYCIVLYCISDAILNYKLRRHVIRTFDFIP